MDAWGKRVVRVVLGVVLGVGVLVVAPRPASAGGNVPVITVVPNETEVQPGDVIHYVVHVENTHPSQSLEVTDVFSARAVCGPVVDSTIEPESEKSVATCERLVRPSDVPAYTGVEVDVTVTGTDPWTSPEADPVDVAFPDHNFPDVAADDDFVDAITWARFFDLVAGFNDGTFRAGSPVTRGQIVNMLWHAVDEPVVNTPHGFVDVPAGAFYRQALNWAKARGLVTGFAGNRYRPNQAVNRGQLVNMAWKMVGSPSSSGQGYSDVTGSFRNAARWTREHHLADAFAPGPQLKPTRSATRGEVVEVLYQLSADRLGWRRWNKAPVSTWTFDDALVEIPGQEYVLNRVTVFPGESVAWHLTAPGSGTLHTVTDPSLGLNEEMGHDDLRTFAFDEPGTYTYHCTIHPSMTGRVTVQAQP